MECKFYYTFYSLLLAFRINRNIVECKYALCFYLAPAQFRELIETLWNVNEIAPIVEDMFNHELIETLWNVNSYSHYQTYQS